MNLYVGTSGYSYKPWKGPFYPSDLPASKMLAFYAERFRTVEINNSFYAMPKPHVLEEWASAVPAKFQFVLKAPGPITHAKDLTKARDSLANFLEVIKALKTHCGPLLFLWPPRSKKDVPRLKAFLTLLPSKLRAAVEFRDASWFDDEVLGLLRKHRVGLCIADAEGDLEVPLIATTDWGYLRLRKAEYDDNTLKTWVKRAQDQGWRDAYVFFRHEDEGKGPKFAQRLLELVADM